jgi:hypothetical protein
VTESFVTHDETLLDCNRRFKNLPDRHFVFKDNSSTMAD